MLAPLFRNPEQVVRRNCHAPGGVKPTLNFIPIVLILWRCRVDGSLHRLFPVAIDLEASDPGRDSDVCLSSSASPVFHKTNNFAVGCFFKGIEIMLNILKPTELA